MTYVVCQPCIGVKDHACVDVCPVECFHEGEDQLLINPDECIECDACKPECPVEAIFHEDDVPEEWHSFIAKNIDPFQSGGDIPPVAKTRDEWEEEREDPESDAAKYYVKYPPPA